MKKTENLYAVVHHHTGEIKLFYYESNVLDYMKSHEYPEVLSLKSIEVSMEDV